MLEKETWENVKLGWDLIQTLVVIGATLFTARWTYKTFGYKEKITSLKNLQQLLKLFKRDLVSYVNLLDLKKEELKQSSISQPSINNIEKLMSIYIQSYYKNKFEIEDILNNDLTLNQIFLNKFFATIKPILSDDLNLNNLKTDDIEIIYKNLMDQITNESNIKK